MFRYANRHAKVCKRFSPRTRGCSGFRIITVTITHVFPAHAGMFRICSGIVLYNRCFPRARGDVPTKLLGSGCERPFSPRTRGCSAKTCTLTTPAFVFPAHAGMFRKWLSPLSGTLGFPRARGDVPYMLCAITCGGMFSPRTRGCSAGQGVDWRQSHVFPAHAGMFLERMDQRITSLCFPRARGDVPICDHISDQHIRFSPRTRGCSATTR